MRILLAIFLFAGVFSTLANGANILGVFTSHSRSHVIVHMAIVKALVERGHNVTVLTSLPLNDKNPGYRHVLLPNSPSAKKLEDEMHAAMSEMAKETSAWNAFKKMASQFGTITNLQKDALGSDQFKDFLKEDNKFDLVLLGYFMNDFQLGIGAHYNCPVAISWMAFPFAQINTFVGNPTEAAYVPNVFLGADQPLNFVQRVLNFLLESVFYVIEQFSQYPMEKYYVEHFPSDKYPSYWEMKKNVSLILINHHFSEGPIRPNVPGMVEIGGIQVKDKPDPLPKNIQKVLDSSSKHGAIFFSMGSNIRSADLRPDTLDSIYKVLSSLKQNVLWKWEGDVVPGNASNILFSKWLPQDDILAHPNLKLFITHGGKGSVVESKYHGVPMVGVPVFGDQLNNIRDMEANGYGLGINYRTMTEQEFRRTVLEVLENEKYTRNVKDFSQLYRDRPMTAKETAVFWLEYVIRTNGAVHMQSPLVHMNLIQSQGWDVIAFLVAVVIVFVQVLKLLWRLVKRACTGSKKAKKPKKD